MEKERMDHLYTIENRNMDKVVVNSTKGRIAGQQMGNGLCVFGGIPFAKATTGPLRFSRPVEPSKWSNIYPAFQFGPVSPQTAKVTQSISNYFQDEDCLHLNIWTPGVDSKRRPVMVYIHGGAYNSGRSSDPRLDGKSFAERGDVVLITINYRLGALGFLYLDHLDSEFSGSGNLGILDQIAALKWIHQNISAFGGDPENVTIFGESAGSMSVCLLMAIPEAKGLFHKAIGQSGIPRVRSTTDAIKVTDRFMELAGAENAGELLSLSTDQIINAQGKLLKEYRLGTKCFGPVLDGYVFSENPLKSIENGSAAGVPFLHGTTKDEYNYWIKFFPELKTISPEEYLSRSPGLISWLDENKDYIITHYRNNYPQVSDSEITLKIMTDCLFWINHIKVAESHGKHSDTWMYMFNWPSPTDGGIYGAQHAIDIPFVFNNLLTSDPVTNSYIGLNPPQHLAQMMHDAWISFARKGDPNHSGMPKWPRYDLEKRSTMVFDSSSEAVYDPKKNERIMFSNIGV